MSDVADRLAAVRDRIAAAAARTGRDPGAITLVAVTKGVAVERITEAVDAGARDLGENRVHELRAKRDLFPAVRWHMVGALQRNKVRHVAGSVALIHSIDSPALGDAVAARARDLGVIQAALLEVNTSGEATKHGVAPDVAQEVAGALAAIDGLALRGLMTIAAPDDQAAARDSFRTLRELGERVRAIVPGAIELSMGMSDDFEVAIEEGATLVRIGTALFGPRQAL